MRKIFNTLGATPNCEAQRLQLEIAKNLAKNSEAEFIEATEKLNENLDKIKSLKNQIESSNKDVQKQEDEARIIRETIKDIRDREIIANCNGRGKNSPKCLQLENEVKIENVKNRQVYVIMARFMQQRNRARDEKKTYDEKTAVFQANVTKTTDRKNLQDELLKELQKFYDSCMNSGNLQNSKNKIFSQSFNLKSNPSCKEIKQKIKIVNRKIISINRKSLDLKYGANSLPILNINKKFSDVKIKIKKELIVKLDKLNPIIFMSDSSFYAIYKKAKDDLASYQTEGKTFEAKFKSLKVKEKNIKDKKISLKDKFSKLIKKLKTC
jgi:hypothetical protein